MNAGLFCFFLSPAQPGSPFACHWNNAVFNQNVATMWPGRNRKTDLGEINRPTVTTHTAGVAWPSGLRRWFKAPVSSEAWVRIPPLPSFCSTSPISININNVFEQILNASTLSNKFLWKNAVFSGFQFYYQCESLCVITEYDQYQHFQNQWQLHSTNSSTTMPKS